MLILVDTVQHSSEEAQTSRVVVILYGNVWICYGDAGRMIVISVTTVMLSFFRVLCRAGVV
jgi:hypothetical protein